MTFIIHGATGAQGAPVLRELLARGVDARGAVRRPDLSQPASVAVDLADADALAAAYSGAEGVFVHLPLGAPDRIAAYARAVVEAVRVAAPARVVISTSGQIVAGPAAEEGVLRYPLPAGTPVWWSSHLDVADVVVRLLTDAAHVTGTVAVGHVPGLVGADLAEGFAATQGSPVRYEPITPARFGELITPLFGAEGSAPVVGLYEALGTLPGNEIAEVRSAQRVLGLTPRSIADWLAAVRG